MGGKTKQIIFQLINYYISRCRSMCQTLTRMYPTNKINVAITVKPFGETSMALNKRMNLHRSDWNTRKFNRSPVAAHFNEEHHSFDNIVLCCIDTKPMGNGKKRETYWIRRLNTLQPHVKLQAKYNRLINETS